MYDNEDEVREKRKKLYFIIGIVIFLILLIIVILLIRMNSKNKGKSDTNLSCTIAVINNVMPNSNGIYEDELEIGFTEINYDDKNGSLIKQTIGTADSSRNTNTFRISKTGVYYCCIRYIIDVYTFRIIHFMKYHVCMRITRKLPM